jgi:hypothetical protein
MGDSTGTTITLGLNSAPTSSAPLKPELPDVCTLVCCSGVVTLIGLYTTTGVEVLTLIPLPAGTPAAAAAAAVAGTAVAVGAPVVTAAAGGPCAA